MSSYKAIPVMTAKAVAEKYDKDQVIIVAWDAAHSKEHVTSYGKTKQHCDQAAVGARRIQQALSWPPENVLAVKANKSELVEVLREVYVAACDCMPQELREKVLKLLGANPNACPDSSLLAFGQAVLDGKVP